MGASNSADPEIVAKINALTHEEMARLWRNAPVGHIYFDTNGPYWPIFEARFRSAGGITPEVSKQIGWEAKS